MGQLWPGAFIGENTLHVHISALRKALGSDRHMLKTESGRGYRLLGTWTIQQEGVRADPDDLQPDETRIEPPRTNLPASTFDLIGRAGSMRELQDLLSGRRLVTLTGPGGIGKTALALEVARSQSSTFDGGVFFVELASLADSRLVPSAAATALGITFSGEEISGEAVARAIGGKKVFIVLDNCEHVVDAAANLAETLVRRCPHLTVLSTSREALRIEGEYLYHVPPLGVPPEHLRDSDDILNHSAVQLFIARTPLLHSEMCVQTDAIPTIAEICPRLDGIPLAIEFAAARAVTLGVWQVAAHLGDRFRLLTGGRRTALPRHQTLRAALDWSYDLLPEPERRLLRLLAIFPAGFTLKGAAAIMDNGDEAELSVVEGIASLVAKSLIVLEKPLSARWRLLETTRAYALEQLSGHGEVEQAARRHAGYCRILLERAESD